eukprot:jgi/Sobl393_1/13279/SZX62656.1
MPFQKLGISFIRDRQQNPQRLLLKIDGQDSLVQMPRGALLFDEMGLGETIQGIGSILATPRLPGQGGALLVVHAALAGQMMAEITLHSNLTVLHYTGIGRHSLPQSVDSFSYDSKGHSFRKLSSLALTEAHKQQQEGQRSKRRRVSQASAAAAAAVLLPAFGSLAEQFRHLLLKYDVVMMSAADAELESRYMAEDRRSSSRAGSSAAAAAAGSYMQSPLLKIEFTQLIVDECQQLGSPNSALCRLLRAVKAQQRLLMSGTPFPAGREAALLKSVLQLLFSGTAGQPAAAAGTSAAAAAAAAAAAPLQPGWIGRLVDRAMQCRNITAASEAQQALKQVLAVLMIRRTRDEVAAEHYTIPPQRHSVVEVAQRHCDAFMTRQLQKTARQ